MHRYPNCTCSDMQLNLVECICGAEHRYFEIAADLQEEFDAEQAAIEAGVGCGSRFVWSKDLDDDHCF